MLLSKVLPPRRSTPFRCSFPPTPTFSSSQSLSPVPQVTLSWFLVPLLFFFGFLAFAPPTLTHHPDFSVLSNPPPQKSSAPDLQCVSPVSKFFTTCPSEVWGVTLRFPLSFFFCFTKDPGAAFCGVVKDCPNTPHPPCLVLGETPPPPPLSLRLWKTMLTPKRNKPKIVVVTKLSISGAGPPPAVRFS